MKKITAILACMVVCFSLFTGCAGMKSRLEDKLICTILDAD